MTNEVPQPEVWPASIIELETWPSLAHRLKYWASNMLWASSIWLLLPMWVLSGGKFGVFIILQLRVTAEDLVGNTLGTYY